MRYKSTTNYRNKENSKIFSPTISMDDTSYYNMSLKPTRNIPKTPFKVLDAPELRDDFYLNLLDWSSQNLLAVGLRNSVFVWSACTSEVTKLCETTNGESITSVAWSERGERLAVGISNGET